MKFITLFVLLPLSVGYLFYTQNNNELKTEYVAGEENSVWVDTAFNSVNFDDPNTTERAVVWFDKQFLGTGASFKKRTKEFEGWKRSELRNAVVKTLKEISKESYGNVKNEIDKLISDNKISNVKRLWIINGFICDITKEGLNSLKELPGVSKIFREFAFTPASSVPEPIGLSYIKKDKEETPFIVDKYEPTWNIKAIGAYKTWKEFGITGKGILNVVHDFGFKLSVPVLEHNIYENPGEIPGNGIDDDNNGYVDDYNGFNFDYPELGLNRATPFRGNIIHGNLCAQIISGRGDEINNTELSVAPDSKWIPLIGLYHLEEAVQWAIEHKADTYSMSFSLPNLGNLRTHWRKVMEQGAFCGVYFISGAGNFADSTKSSFAPVPVQMRIPEDIPGAVFGVSGIGKDTVRPVFASQGPVEWENEHYNDGLVQKPDFSTFNNDLNYVDLDGKIAGQIARGNSFAGPHFAGVISLLLEANPELLPWKAREMLIKTAKDIGEDGVDYQFGYGLVNAYRAVKEVLKEKNMN